MKFMFSFHTHRIAWVGGISLLVFIFQYFLVDRSLSTLTLQTDFLGIADQKINILQLPLTKLLITFYHIAFLCLSAFGIDRIYCYFKKEEPIASSPQSSQEVNDSIDSNAIIIAAASSDSEEKKNKELILGNHSPSKQDIIDFLSQDDDNHLEASAKQTSVDKEHSPYAQLDKRIRKQLTELENLVGLSQVKTEIHSILNFIKINHLRSDHGLVTHDISYHMVFTGNPGTGKTSVARILANIFKELNMLSKGHLVETDRAGLVAGFVGQTALKVKEVVESARGGVLFIDEAYSLTNQSSSNDYGKEAIDTLIKYMEDYRQDLIVIVAGYKDVMKDFIHSNPGLKSRFNRYIYFPDYTAQEMLEILYGMSQKVNYIYSSEAEAYLIKFFQWILQNDTKNFGNGRGVRNLFETIITVHANRISKLDNPTQEVLSSIILQDVTEAVKKTTKHKL